MRIKERLKQALHDFLLALIDFMYPVVEGPKRERLTTTEWIVGSVILVVIVFAVVIIWINDLK